MNETKLGQVPEPGAERDAVNVAIIPAVAGAELMRGDWVTLFAGRAIHAFEVDAIGIVDPFGEMRVGIDQRFWLCLKPNSVTGMRHHWQHSKFDKSISDASSSLVPVEHHGQPSAAAGGVYHRPPAELTP